MRQSSQLRYVFALLAAAAIGSSAPAGVNAAEIVIDAGSANCIRFSPDAKTLATCGYGRNTVLLWDTASGKLVGKLTVPGKVGRGNDIHIRSAAWSPDGKNIVCGCDDLTVRLFDVAEEKEIARMNGHTHRIWFVDFAPDGNSIASGDQDGTVNVWDVETYAQQMSFENKDGRPRIAYSGNAKMLAMGSDTRLQIWDFEERRVCFDEYSQTSVYGLAFSHSGDWVATGGVDRMVRVWNVESGKIDLEFATRGYLIALAFSPKDDFVAAVDVPGKVALYRRTDGAKASVFEHSKDEIASIDFSRDGAKLAASSSEGKVVIWDVSLTSK